jgi:hypothetical protein
LKKKLNYRFHNPNSVEDTADFLCKLFIEVNQAKVEKVIQEAVALKEATGEYISPVKENEAEQVNVPKRKEKAR